MSLRITNLGKLAPQVAHEGVQVFGAPATGMALHTNGNLGADLLHVPAGQRFPVHTHPGDHLLLCVQGHGTITIDQITYDVEPGDLYMVDGQIPHAVGAVSDHVLLAVGSPHKPIDSPERMTLVDWDNQVVDTPLLAT